MVAKYQEQLPEKISFTEKVVYKMDLEKRAGFQRRQYWGRVSFEKSPV